MKKTKTTSRSPRLTVRAGAREFNVSHESLRRLLKGIGEDTRRGSKFTLKTIYRALTADGRAERHRKARANAETAEINLRTLKERLVDVAAIEKRIGQMLELCRERFTSLPVEICARCNPSDPQLARKALEDWTVDALRTVPKGVTR